MKKNNFIDGAIVATISLVFCKILGLIYVIPFYKIIGTQGGALYSYAYSIYAVFLNLSTVGIPSAVAKIISEYDALDYQGLKTRAYGIASKMLNYAGILSFIILFLFANVIANSIIGGVEGGNSVASVAIAIRVVSLALLVVPKLSILRGYFQGNKYIAPSSFSSILEQLVRVLIIIVGSYVVVNILHMPVDYAVYVAISGATFGALSSYFYLKIKSKPYIEKDKTKQTKPEEKSITTKFIIKKIVVYAIPFVIISMLQSAYNVVDTFTVVKTLTSLNYSTQIAETTIGVMSTWGSKLNMIVISMSIGMTASLIPNIVGSYAKKDFKDINEKIDLSMEMLLYTTIPMTIGISFLSLPIWHVFYGIDSLSTNIFRVYIIQVLFYGLYSTIITISQSMNQTKITIGSLIVSLLLKLVLNVPMMHLFNSLNIPAYYAPTFTDIISQFSVYLSVLYILKKKYDFKYKRICMFALKSLICSAVMILALIITKSIYFNNTTITTAIITIVIHTLIGASIYFTMSHIFRLFDEVFGVGYLDKVLKKFKLKK